MSKNAVCGYSTNIKLDFDQLHSSPPLFYRCQNDEVWTADYIGSVCEKIFECDRQKFISHETNFANFIVETDKDMIHDVVQTALIQHRGFQLLYHIKTEKGKLKILFEQGEGIFNEYGEVSELVGFVSDVTEVYQLGMGNHSELLKNCAIEINKLMATDGLSHTNLPLLSLREIETLLYLCQGMTMKEIGLHMHISPRTVEMNIRHAKAKLGCHSQIELRNLFSKTSCGKKLIIEELN